MFGITDPGIWLAYVLEVLCLLVGAYYGIRYWNKDDSASSNQQKETDQ